MNPKIFFLTVILLLASSSAFAKRMISKDPASHFSENKKYEMQIFERTIVDGACKAVFKKENQTVWEKILPSTPGIVNVSNDGQSIVFVNWGWADEGGFKSVSFYDGQGHERGEVKFGAGEEDLRWIREAYLSSNGKYFVLYESASSVSFYSVEEPKLLWEKTVSKTEKGYLLEDLQVSEAGDFLLFCTYKNDGAEAFFAYWGKDSKTIWEKRIPKGYPLRKGGWFGIVTYANEKNQKFIKLDTQGKKFSIYSLPESRWINFENNGGKIVEIN